MAAMAQAPAKESTIRHITFWREGFTVEDGELMRYDDPKSETILTQINSGRAPPSIFNVRPGELIELRVANRTGEDYVPPKHNAFFGSSTPSVEPATKFEVDQNQSMTSVQISFADRTSTICRMNSTHTVLDLKNFINASRPESLTRPYSIWTTFPNRILDDNNLTLEAAGLKNCVVVQKWD